MKAIVKTKPGPGAELLEVDVPVPGPTDILVKVISTSICGTDLHIYQWNDWAKRRIKKIPQIMGHELCGEVVELGKTVKNVKPGDVISAETHIACGHCFMCQNGLAHICLNGKIFGVDIDGVFAEYAVVPASNAWHLPDKIASDYITIMEPLGNAVHTVLAGETSGTQVLVTGCGPLGLMAVALCRVSGVTKVIAAEVNDYRLHLAGKVGADVMINPEKEALVPAVMKATGNVGVDAVLEMSGNAGAISDGFKSLRPGGRFTMLGLPDQAIKIDLNEIIFKYLTIQGINGRLMFSTWHKSTRFLSSGRLDLEPIITHRFRLNEFAKGMELMESGNCGKVLLYP